MHLDNMTPWKRRMTSGGRQRNFFGLRSQVGLVKKKTQQFDSDRKRDKPGEMMNELGKGKKNGNEMNLDGLKRQERIRLWNEE